MSDDISDNGVTEDLRRAIRVAHAAGLEDEDGRDSLSMELYTSWFAQSSLHHPAAPEAAAPLRLLAALRESHAASVQFEEGWVATAIGPQGAVAAQLGAEQIEVQPPDYANLERLAAPVRVGDRLAVSRRRDMVDEANGWWITEARVGAAPGPAMVRVYWNCPASTVTSLVAGLTAVLEKAGLPYTMKCPLEAQLFGRVDAVVLYMGADAFAETKSRLRAVHADLADAVRTGVPPLTLPIGRGVALAEDPANGQSFGQSRCGAVADGLIRASNDGITDEAEVVEAILQQFPDHGIARDRPFLSADSPHDLVTSW